MPNMEKVTDWNEADIPAESISQEEISNVENSGRVPPGKYLCRCVDSRCVRKDFKAYSCHAARLTWEIKTAYELNGKAVKSNEGDDWVGRTITDDVALFSPYEKEGMRIRRLFIAKHVGLINENSREITPEMWSTKIIGKEAILTYIDEAYENKKGESKTFRKIAFDGYDYAPGREAESEPVESEDPFFDI